MWNSDLKMKILSHALPFLSLSVYARDYAECTHTLLSANNKSNSSVPGGDKIVTTHCIKWVLVSCQCTHLKRHPLVQTLQSNLTYIKESTVSEHSFCTRQYISDQYMFFGFFYPLWETIIWVEQYLPMSQTVKLFSIKDSNIQLNTWLLTEDLSHVQTSFWWKKTFWRIPSFYLLQFLFLQFVSFELCPTVHFPCRLLFCSVKIPRR